MSKDWTKKELETAGLAMKRMGFMSYEEFLEAIAEDLHEPLFPELGEVSVTTRKVDKLQGESYLGLYVKPKDSNLGACFCERDAYESYTPEAYGNILDEITAEVVEALKNPKYVNEEFKNLGDYEGYVKEHLLLQLVPVSGNEDMLRQAPHRVVEDLAIVYRIIVSCGPEGMRSVLINNDNLNLYGISADELHRDVLENAPKNFPASIRSIVDVLLEQCGGSIQEVERDPDAPVMYVATSSSGYFGAGCLFYPDFLRTATETIGGGFFVIPSSIHEVLLLSDNTNMTLEELEDLIRSVNTEEVAPEDRLSDQLYHYDAEAERFETGKEYIKRKG